MRTLLVLALLGAAPGRALALEGRLLDETLSLDPAGGEQSAASEFALTSLAGTGAFAAHLFAGFALPVAVVVGMFAYNFTIGDWTGLYVDTSLMESVVFPVCSLGSLLAVPLGMAAMVTIYARAFGRSPSYWWTVAAGYLAYLPLMVAALAATDEEDFPWLVFAVGPAVAAVQTFTVMRF